jgi:anti-sigma B factor antagonist
MMFGFGTVALFPRSRGLSQFSIGDTVMSSIAHKFFLRGARVKSPVLSFLSKRSTTVDGAMQQTETASVESVNIRIYTIEDRIVNASNALLLRDKLAAIIGDGESRTIVDMSSVERIDASGVGALLSALKMVGRNGEFTISALTDSVARTFRHTRMDRVFTILTTDDSPMSTAGFS